jgi:drug/metabolite transporter (DMT)-like permease
MLSRLPKPIADEPTAPNAEPEVAQQPIAEPTSAPSPTAPAPWWADFEVARLWRDASSNLRATIMTLVSIAIFSIVLSSIKLIGMRIPMSEILLIRQIVVSLVIVHFLKGRVRQALRTNNLTLQILRGLFSYGSQLTQFIAMLYIPFAEVTALGFSQVIFITIAAAIVLGESVHWRCWLATGVGFSGVMIMLWPTGEGLNIFALMALSSGLLSAGVSITIRSMAHTESTVTIMLYQSAILCLAFVGPALWWWVWPTPAEWGHLVMIGVLGAVAQFLFTRACQIGEAAALAPLEFSRLLITAAVGYFVFLEVPSPTLLAGALIVIASTVYTVRHNF